LHEGDSTLADQQLEDRGKTIAAVSVANSDVAVQCMGAREKEELERQEGQTNSAGKETRD
jgi:hypothetical protein